jgi:hypothetical protein
MRHEKPCATLVDVLLECEYDRAVLSFIRAVREREPEPIRQTVREPEPIRQTVPDPIRQKLREKLARRVLGLDVESDVESAVRGLCRIDAPS